MEHEGIVVSIIVPTYNREALLARAIASIRSQSFKAWELIVMNDASTDGTKDYLERLAKEDPKIRPVHNIKNNYPDISKTLNDGIALARGKYIARLDDDDYWCDDEKLKKQVAFLEAHPDYVVTGGGTIVVDANGRELSRYLKPETDEAIRAKALLVNPFTHSTTVYRTDAARSVGGYGAWEQAEDWDFWLKLGTKGKMHNFPEYFVCYLSAGQNKSFIYLRAQTRTIYRFIMLHHREYPGFYKALTLNTAQYVYSLLPLFIRKNLHGVLSSLKRKV